MLFLLLCFQPKQLLVVVDDLLELFRLSVELQPEDDGYQEADSCIRGRSQDGHGVSDICYRNAHEVTHDDDSKGAEEVLEKSENDVTLSCQLLDGILNRNETERACKEDDDHQAYEGSLDNGLVIVVGKDVGRLRKQLVHVGPHGEGDVAEKTHHDVCESSDTRTIGQHLVDVRK